MVNRNLEVMKEYSFNRIYLMLASLYAEVQNEKIKN